MRKKSAGLPKPTPFFDNVERGSDALFVQDRELHRRVCRGEPAGGIGRQIVGAWNDPTRNQRREDAR
jgi:hypothetical protein